MRTSLTLRPARRRPPPHQSRPVVDVRPAARARGRSSPTTTWPRPAGSAGGGRGTSARSTSSATAHSLVLGHTDTAAVATLRAIAATVESAVPAVLGGLGDGLVAHRRGRRPVHADRARRPGRTNARRSPPTSRRWRSPTATRHARRRPERAAAGRQPGGVRPAQRGRPADRRPARDHPHRRRREPPPKPARAGWSRASPTTWAISAAGSRRAPPRPSSAATCGPASCPTTLPEDAAFDTTGTAAQAYEGAWLACRLIAARAGQPALVRFYKLVGASPADADAAVAAALQRVLHETTAAFTAQWRAYVKHELG